jgi:VIT1/CCC1 family predicted Fe2+/Mn2+ transporter
LVTGLIKVFWYGKAQKVFPWAQDMPRWLVYAFGAAEILGALGLVLPVAVGFYPWLTPVAAIVLGSLMLSAATFHVLRREKDEAILPVFLLILLAVVAYIRWPLMP